MSLAFEKRDLTALSSACTLCIITAIPCCSENKCYHNTVIIKQFFKILFQQGRFNYAIKAVGS